MSAIEAVHDVLEAIRTSQCTNCSGIQLKLILLPAL